MPASETTAPVRLIPTGLDGSMGSLKRAVIIKSEGELTAAENLERAVNKMSNRAMYLRTLSSLEDISFDQSNTIVFAVPLESMRDIMAATSGLQVPRPKRSKK